MQAHHHRLAQRVDRRVRHLRKSLPKIPIHRPRTPRQECQRRIIPHRPHAVLAVRRHRLQHHLHVFARIPEPALQLQQLLPRHRIRPSLPAQRPPYPAASRTARSGRTGPAARRFQIRFRPPGRPPASRPAPAARYAPPAPGPDPPAPASEPATTSPSSVIANRHGRSPFRSSAAPTTQPSANEIAAGPSQGSTQSAW